MKKLYQWVVIGGIGIVLLYLVHKKLAINARDLSQGGGGGGQLAEGKMVIQSFQQCIKSGMSKDVCEQMIPL
jgi:hypothetical protein